MRNVDRFDPDAVAAAAIEAETLVTDEKTLWDEFIALLNVYGQVLKTTEDGFDYRSRYETKVRRFVITSPMLRKAFVEDCAYQRLNENVATQVRALPAWFTDQVVEFIGSVYEPYDDDYVILTKSVDFSPSPDGINPNRNSPWGKWD